jgi:pimeloyl-ACP methyl ester carboxylesterase
VFLHGDLGRASKWHAVGTLVAPSHDTVAFDFRGAGSSELARNPDYSTSVRAGDPSASVTAFDLSDFVIIADSSAAAVVLSFAPDHDGISGILLVDPATDRRDISSDLHEGFVHHMAGPERAAVFQKYAASIVGDDPQVRSQVIADGALFGSTTGAGLAATVAAWNPSLCLMPI